MINNYTNIISAATSSLSNLDEQHPCDPANNVALQELIGDITKKIENPYIDKSDSDNEEENTTVDLSKEDTDSQ